MLALVAAQPGGRNQKGMGTATDHGSPRHMVIFYLTIPLMLVAIGFAVVPLLWAMKRQVEAEARVSVVGGTRGSSVSLGAVMPRVTDGEDPFTDVSALAA